MKIQAYILLSIFFLVAFVGTASAAILTVTPDPVVVSEFVTIESSGFGATETVTLRCSIFDFVIPVSDDKYKYRLEDFNLSDSNILFSLSAREVDDDMTLIIKTGSWLVTINGTITGVVVFDYEATNKTASVSTGESMPTGIYGRIEVRTVADNTTGVYMNISVTNGATTNAKGYFKTVIDAQGIPTGEYEITAEGVNTTLNVTAPSTCNISLTAGWILISVHLNRSSRVLGEEATVGDILCVTQNNSLTSIYRYNTTTVLFDKCDHLDDWGWWPATGSENFTELGQGRGYWVWANSGCVAA